MFGPERRGNFIRARQTQAGRYVPTRRLTRTRRGLLTESVRSRHFEWLGPVTKGLGHVSHRYLRLSSPDFHTGRTSRTTPLSQAAPRHPRILAWATPETCT